MIGRQIIIEAFFLSVLLLLMLSSILQMPTTKKEPTQCSSFLFFALSFGFGMHKRVENLIYIPSTTNLLRCE